MEYPELPDVAEITDVLTTRIVASKGRKRCFAEDDNGRDGVKKIKPTPYICLVCSKDFESEKYLRMHVVLHRQSVENNLATSLPNGVSMHGNSNDQIAEATNYEEKLICPICSKIFSQTSTLKNHVKTHCEDRPFICTICSIGFKERYHLKKHVLFRHSEELNMSCRFCDKKFKDATAVRAHERIHSEDRPYGCRNCLKSFKTSECLWHHEHRSKACSKAKRLNAAYKELEFQQCQQQQQLLLQRANDYSYDAIYETDEIDVDSLAGEINNNQITSNQMTNNQITNNQITNSQNHIKYKNVVSGMMNGQTNNVNNNASFNGNANNVNSKIIINLSASRNLIGSKVSSIKDEKMSAETAEATRSIGGLFKTSEVRLFKSDEFGTILGLPLGHPDRSIEADADILKKIKESYLLEASRTLASPSSTSHHGHGFVESKNREITSETQPPTAIVSPLIRGATVSRSSASSSNSGSDFVACFKGEKMAGKDFAAPLRIVPICASNQTYVAAGKEPAKYDVIHLTSRQPSAAKSKLPTSQDKSEKSLLSLMNMSAATSLLQSTAILMKKQHNSPDYSLFPIHEELNNLLKNQNYFCRFNNSGEEDVLDEIHLDIDPYWDMGQQISRAMSPMSEEQICEEGNIASLTSWEQELLADLRMTDVAFQ